MTLLSNNNNVLQSGQNGRSYEGIWVEESKVQEGIMH